MLSTRPTEPFRIPNVATDVSTILRTCLETYLLTVREVQIVLLVLQGMSNKEIARTCSITEQTVKDHLKHAYGKMGVHQRAALCAKVFRSLLDPIPLAS